MMEFRTKRGGIPNLARRAKRPSGPGIGLTRRAISQIAAEYFDRPKPNHVPKKSRNELIPRKLKKRQRDAMHRDIYDDANAAP